MTVTETASGRAPVVGRALVVISSPSTTKRATTHALYSSTPKAAATDTKQSNSSQIHSKIGRAAEKSV